MSLLDTKFLLFAFIWSRFYIAPVYLLSFAIPRLKKIIQDYENNGDRKSLIFISTFSGILMSIGFYFLGSYMLQMNFGPTNIILLVIACCLWGYYWLFLQAEYKNKTKKS